MNKLKITNINQTFPPEKIQKSDGPGTFDKFKWSVNATQNGQAWQNVTLITFSSWVAQKVLVNSEWNVQQGQYNGMIEFKITDKKPQQAGGYGGKGNYKKVPFEKISALADMCWKWVEGKPLADEKNKVEMFKDLLVCAGINIEWDTINSPLDQQVQNNIDNLNTVMNGQQVQTVQNPQQQQVQGNQPNNQWPGDDDIPY